MTAAQLLAEFKRRDIRLWCENGHIRYDAPKGALTDELRARIAACHGDLLDLLNRHREGSGEGAIVPVSRTGPLPLSFGQQRLWFVEQINPGNLAYNVPATVRLHRPLDPAALGRAVNAVIRRHETLRCSFPTVDGAPSVVIAADLALDTTPRSLESLPESDRLTAAIGFAHEAALRPFDLARGPLVRAELFRLAPDDHLLHVSMHHIISDGWSMGVFFNELGECYPHHLGDAQRATPSPLVDLPIQYVDYAQWQRDRLEDGRLQRDLDYWRRQLGGDLSILQLPTDAPRPSAPTHRGGSQWMPIDPAVYRGLQELAQSEQATLFQVLFAAFAALLSRTTGQEDIVVGTPIAGRGRREVEPLIGFFVNTLVLRTDCSGEPTFRALLGRVRATVLDAFTHQEVPFERIVDEVQPERDFSRNPLFQVLFNHYNLQQYTKTLGPLQLESLETSLEISKFDLTLHCYEDRGRLIGKLEYSTDLFQAETVERLGRHYVTLLKGICATPDVPITHLPLMDADERHEVIVDWNATEWEPATPPCVPERMATQARRYPEEPALVDEARPMTYRQLATQTDRLARHLIGLGVQAEDRVAIFLERSPETIIALLAVLKAGAAYVPLDPATPRDRLAFMLTDSGSRIVLTQSSLLGALPPEVGTIVSMEDGDWTDSDNDRMPLPTIEPDQLAYVIYTSGSTGKSKGVEIEHRQLANYVDGILPVLDLPRDARYATVSTIAADLGNTVVFAALCSGGALHVMSERCIGDADAFAAAIDEHRIDCIKIVPSHLEALLTAAGRPANTLPRALLVLGGEACPWELVERVWALAPDCSVVNHYGPTETTVGVLTHRLQPTDRERFPLAPPIGRPIANTQVYILDRAGEPVPVGAIGELHIGGRSVARGYLDRPELTAEKFIRDPFRDRRGAKLYRTGDLARHTPRGDVLFMGRRDDQVKLRGYRVELGEIRATLERHPEVGTAAVIVRESAQGDKRLVAYFTAKTATPPSTSDIRLFLKQQLPDHMVPGSFLLLDRIPLTPNGKLDRQALPAPEDTLSDSSTHYQPPRTDTEVALARIWSEVLRVESVGINDDFFELGGESILSIQIISRANQAGLRLTPRDLFERPTIAQLSRVVSRAPAIAAEQGVVTGPVPLTPIEHRFFEQSPAAPGHYNHAMLLKLSRLVQPEILEGAVAALLEHHDALRLRFERAGADWRQENAGLGDPVPFTHRDLSHHAPDARRLALEACAAEVQASLHLTGGPLLAVAQFHLGDGEQDRLLIIIHHAAVDGISWRILLEDLQLACEQLDAGSTVQLPPKTTSFKAWAEHLAEHARSEEAQAELDHWLEVVDGEDQPIPRDREPSDGDLVAANVAVHTECLNDAETTTLLQEVPKAYRTQINDILLTALAETIASWTGSRSVRVDLEGHGREDLFPDVDCSRTVGWFTAVYPVRLTVPEGQAPGASLKSIKEQLRSIPGRGVGWGILRYLTPADDRPRALQDASPGEITFNYLGQFDQIYGERSLFAPAPESAGPPVGPHNRRRTLLDVTAAVSGGRLRVNFVYNHQVHEVATIEQLSQRFFAELRGLIAHCTSPQVRGCTPSDFPLARLTQDELDRIEARYTAENIEDLAVLSPVQEGMIYHTLSEPESAAYVTQMAFTLVGDVDTAALRRAWQQVTDLHAALRTAVVVGAARHLHQVVCRHAEVRWVEEDWRQQDEATIETQLAAVAEAEQRDGIELEEPPLMRFRVIRVGDDRYRFIWTHHHVLLDGWSLPLLIRDVFQAYRAERDGGPFALDPGPPFFSYLRWLQQQDRGEAEAYWRTQLAGWYEPTPLPMAQRAGRGIYEPAAGSIKSTALSAEATERLQSLARHRQLTLNTVVLGAWALLLARHSGRRDVLFGVTMAGRPADLPDVERTLGMFINTLPLRVATEDEPLLSWLQRIQSQQLELQRFDYAPLYEIQQYAPGQGHGRLFDSIFVFENFPTVVRNARHDERAMGIENPQDVSFANYPLAAVVRPGRQLALELRYDRRFFDDATVTELLAHFRSLLESMLETPGAWLDELPMLDAAERHRAVVQWNQTATAFPRDRTVHDLFEAQAAARPDATALVFDEKSVTYRQLDERANQLAHWLGRRGVVPGTLVGICVERGVDLVVAMLGILKAGGVYVPLDPEHPPSRLASMLQDAGASLVLTHERWLGHLPASGCEPICLDRDWPSIATEPGHGPARDASADDLAYVIYTSGSTGRPKGVCVPHRAIVRLVMNTDYLQLSASDRIAQAANASFDAATFEIWGLLNGAQVIGLGPDVTLSPIRFAQAIGQRGITVLFVTTALFNQLAVESPGIFESLRCLLFGGEAVDPIRVRSVLEHGPPQRLLHVYGPTENTTFSTWHRVEAVSNEARTVPIGRAIANTTAYVLDDRRQPVAPGAPGELYVGGDGLARGYLNDPELTAARFVDHPFSDDPSDRLYRTGDLVRRRLDGDIEFIGRIDNQVKLRGFRIELGEIESALQQVSALQHGVVVCREDELSEKRLVAYLVSDGGGAASPEAMRAHLRETLPEYMIPSAFVFLDSLPLNPNGKVDRRALPAPSGDGSREGTYVAPQSKLEECLAAIWCDVLGLEQVGVRDNFFDLGGHSLRLLQVHRRLMDEVECDLNVTDLFQYPTIAALAARLHQGGPQEAALQRSSDIRVRRRSGVADNSIAVVAMVGRFPGAANVPALWDNLCAGVEGIRVFTDEELRAAGIDETLIANPDYVKARGVIDDVDLFDAQFFGFNPREAELIDPQHRIFLECAWEAMETAGYDPQRYPGLIGVYAGATMNTYLDNLRSRPELFAAAGGTQALIAADKDFLATRVSYKLNLRGPSMNVQTACSTSLVAIHEACRSLIDHQCDIAMAGGVAVTVPVVQGYMYQEAGIRSSDGHCRAFDAEARGTVTGNGVAVVVLKRLDEAVREGDQIHAVIRGTAVNNDGSRKVGYTAPSVEGQAEAIALAQATAGVDPDTIGFVEAHGTGTALGDPIEVAALTKVFRERTSRKQFCALGSIKSNLGHTNDAAGAAGLIKAALALKHGKIPPTLHFQRPNPEIDLENSPFFVNSDCRDWKTTGSTPRRAAVSSFGLGGSNAHAVLEEAPPLPPSGSSRQWQLLALSARTPAALDTAATNLARHLQRQETVDLADAAYTLQVGRAEFEHRRAVLCRTTDEAAAGLHGETPDRVWTRKAAATDHPVVFMFPGQGAQYVNMARDLYQGESVFRDTVDACLAHLERHLEFDLRAVLYADTEDGGAAARLKRTSVAQPALFVVEYALAQLWRSWGVEPAACIGHSIGEYAAACVSGVLELEDALHLVAARGRLMEQMPEGVMLAVPLSEDELRDRLAGAEGLWLATVNTPALCVVSGAADRIAAFERHLAESGVDGQRLHTSHAFHSGLMDAAVEPFVEIAREVTIKPPRIPYPSNVTGKWITEAEVKDPRYWGRHIREAVRFADGIGRILDNPHHVLLEVGPGQVLGSLCRQHPGCDRDRVVVSSLRHPQKQDDDLAVLMSGLGRLWASGVSVHWLRFHAGQQRHRIALPTYPMERRRYWVERRRETAGGASARKDIGDWFYARVWRRTTGSSELATSSKPDAGCWLVFSDASTLGPWIAEALAADGRAVVVVTVGSSYAETADGYTIDPGCPDHYHQLIADLKRRTLVPREIVHLWTLAPEEVRPLNDQAARRCQDRGFFSLLSLARSLGEAEIVTPIRITTVTDRIHQVTGDEVVRPEAATILGPCRVIGLEFPDCSCRNIDLSADELTSADDPRLKSVIGELLSNADEPVVAYRGGRRWVEAFAPVRLPAAPDAHPRLREGGTYLITGGFGGMGMALAQELAGSLHARLVLTGRTVLPTREDWQEHLAEHGEEDDVSRRIRAVETLEGKGAQVMVMEADVADLDQTREVVRAGQDRFGRINGVIHAAGVPGSGLILLKEREQALAVLAPKVRGAAVLEALACDMNLDFMVLCSSLNAVKGFPGVVDYAAANAYLDAFARRFADDTGTFTVSINWNRWRESGMAVRVAGRPLPTSQGISDREGAEVFRRILAHAPEPQVLVSETDLCSALAATGPVSDAPTHEHDHDSFAASTAQHAYPRPNISSEYAAPGNELEWAVAEIWRGLFGIDEVGVHDDFFELGGHSLLATQLLNRLKERTPGAGLSLRAIFDHPTVSKLARLIESAGPAVGDVDEHAKRASRIPAVAVDRIARDAELYHDDVNSLSDEEVDWLLNRILQEEADGP